MKITEKSSEKLKKEYDVVVEAASINDKMDARLKQLGAQVKIPGFRPGHIPTNILKQRYGKSVMGEVIEDAIRDAMQEVVKKHNLRLALQPNVKVTDYKEEGDLAFTMTTELFPEVPDVAFDKITVEKLAFEVPDAEVADALARIAERNRTPKALDAGAKAKKGHTVKIDFKGSIGGVPFEGGEAKNFHLELGSNQFIEGFEDQLVGAKAGDATVVKVTFPANYHKEDLQGKPAEFAVTVHEVMEMENPAVDDAFAKALGLKDLESLQGAVKEQLAREYEAAVRNKMKKQLFDHLENTVKFDVPPGMLELEFNSIWEKLQEAIKAGDPSVSGKPEAELKQEYRQIAARRVRLGILLAEIGNKNKISVTRDELTQAVMRQAGMFPGQEKKVLEFYRQNPAQVEDLRGPILEEKSVDFILSKVKLNERKVSIEELSEEEGADSPKEAKTKKAKK